MNVARYEGVYDEHQTARPEELKECLSLCLGIVGKNATRTYYTVKRCDEARDKAGTAH